MADPNSQGNSGRTPAQPKIAVNPAPLLDPKTGKPILVDPIARVVNRKKPKVGGGLTPARIIQRQQILKAAGFQVAVDGVWGPRTQRAWKQYWKTGAPAPFVSADTVMRREREQDMRDAKGISVPRPSPSPDTADAAANRRMKREQERQAHRAAARERVQKAKTIIARSARVSQNPQFAATLNLRQLTDVLTARGSKSGLDTEAGYRATRAWLIQHGHDIEDDDPVTERKNVYKSLVAAVEAAEKAERRKAVQAVYRDAYQPLGIQAGDKVDWLPGGIVPKPGDLIELVEAGGFTAHLIEKAFAKRLHMQATGFPMLRYQALMDMALAVQPFGSVNLAEMAPNLSAARDVVAEQSLVADILLGADIVPTTRKFDDPEVIAAAAKQAGEIKAQVRALLRSNSVEEFTKKRAVYMAVEEQKMIRLQARLAEESMPWWGKTVERYASMAETFAVGTTLATQQILAAATGGPGVEWEDAQAVWGAQPDDYTGDMQMANPIALTAGSLIIDPLNFLPPLRVGSMVVKVGITGGRSLGFASAATGKRLGSYGLVSNRGYMSGNQFLTRSIVWEKGTWSKAATARGILNALPDGARFHETGTWARVEEVGAKLGKTKDAMLDAVSQRATLQFRNGFRKGNYDDLLGDNAITYRTLPSAVRKAVDEGEIALDDAITKHYRTEKFASELARKGVSLYEDAARSTPSRVGAALYARMAEEVRTQLTLRFALNAARQVLDSSNYDTILETMAGSGRVKEIQRKGEGTGKFRLLKDDTGKDPVTGRRLPHRDDYLAMLDEIEQKAIEEFNRVFNAAEMSYLAGGTADRALQDAIRKEQAYILNQFENSLIPAIQRRIEKEDLARKARFEKSAADQMTETESYTPLYDERGLWSGRGGAVDQHLREFALESFDEDKLVAVPNPQWGRPHTYDDFVTAVEDEVRRRQGRLHLYSKRVKVGGYPSDFDLVKELDEQRTDVLQRWRQGDDGLWYDDRAEVMVSDLYVRRLNAVRAEFASDRIRPGSGWVGDWLAGMAQAPTPFTASGWGELFVGDLAWTLGARFSTFGLNSSKISGRASIMQQLPEDARVRDFRPSSEFGFRVPYNDPERSKALIEAGQELTDALRAAHEANVLGWDYIKAREILSEWAWWSALGHAQSGPLRMTYKALNAGLSTWIFLTLPLRPGWLVRNVVDNFTKVLIESVRDPRVLFMGAKNPGQGVKSILGIGVHALRAMIRMFDTMFGTNVGPHFDRLMDHTIWSMPVEAIKRVFDAYDIPVPEEALHRARFAPMETRILSNPHRLDEEMLHGKPITDPRQKEEYLEAKVGLEMYKSKIDEEGRDAAQRWLKTTYDPHGRRAREFIDKYGEFSTSQQIARFKQNVWAMVGEHPEAYFRRIIYRAEMRRELRDMENVVSRLDAATAERRAALDERLAYAASLRIEAEQAREEVARLQAIRDDIAKKNRRNVVEVHPFFFDPNDPRQLHFGDSMYTLDEDEAGRLAGRRLGAAVRKFRKQIADDAPSLHTGPDAAPAGPHAGRDNWLNARGYVTTVNGKVTSVKITKYDFAREYFEKPRLMGGKRDVQAIRSKRIGGVTGGEMPLAPAKKKIRKEAVGDRPVYGVTDEWLAKRVRETIKMHHKSDPRFNPKQWEQPEDVPVDQAVAHANDLLREAQEEVVDVEKWLAWEQDIIRQYQDGLNDWIKKQGFKTKSELVLAAHDKAWAKVEATLFDYSQISVAEENLRLFFPFVQFWRKNTTFWMRTFVEKPWVPLSIIKIEQEIRERNTDVPEPWRRYIRLDGLADAMAKVPGLGAVVDALGIDETAFDPMQMFSFAPIYRTFKDENPYLAPDQLGNKFFGPIIDAIQEWGLGINPIVLKPLESAGIANERAWQTMFPQTSLAVAVTREFWSKEVALDVAGWESLWGLLPTGVDPNAIAKNYDYYVNVEMTGQIERGETPSRARAEKVITAWFYHQALMGYFGGVYLRRMNASDIHIASLYEDWKESMRQQSDETFTSHEWTIINTWRKRDYSPMEFDRYVENIPAIEAYHRQGSWDEAQAYLAEHPEVEEYVNQSGRRRWEVMSAERIQTMQNLVDTDAYFVAAGFLDNIGAQWESKRAASRLFITPELQSFWDKNNTPAEQRAQMIQAEQFAYYDSLNKRYFDIPEDDYARKDAFLDAFPNLTLYWNQNNDPADDYEAIANGWTAALREQFFDLRERHGWDKANEFLRAFPFMFEGTGAARKVNPETGEWKGITRRGRAYRKAKPYLNWFFKEYMKKVGEKKAWRWLDTSDTPAAKIIKDYLDNYSKNAGARLAYKKAEPWLKIYWGLPKDQRGDWLNGKHPGAKIVKDFFEKYASKKGMTQHARDYLAIKGLLDQYFAMTKADRADWLKSGSPEATQVLEYFKKYGKGHRAEKSFKRFFEKNPDLIGGTPEQRKRLDFWRTYFSLTPDQRPGFVHEHAESYGIFIWGEFGEQQREDAEAAFLRRSVGQGLSKKQREYLYVKPLLDFYFNLPKSERPLFQRANPEVAEYLAKHGDKTLSGNKQLDRLIKGYFDLPSDSLARSAYLRKHPDVQDYFDEKSTPAMRAMRNLLEQYFAIRDPEDRKEMIARHPEIQAYFDRRKDERSRESDALTAFDQADPRLAQYYEDADDVMRAAEEMRLRLRRQALGLLKPPSGLDLALLSSRGRQPMSA